jgi:DNA polymerase IV (DinB-like DNA polymerase)
MQEYADIFEYVGRDEAYLDITRKTNCNYNIASHTAQQLKNAIREKTKLGCSVGVSPNKLVSKIASDYKKPDGLTIVTPDMVSSFLEPLNIRDIPYIGKKTEQALKQLNTSNIKQLRELNIFTLNQKFGRKTGTYIYNAVRGIDDEPVSERGPSIQFSKISTLKSDSIDFDFLHKALIQICKELHHTILKNNKLFKLVGIQFVHYDLTGKTKTKMLKNPTSNLEELQRTATILLKEALQGQEKNIRRLGVKVAELSDIKGQNSIDNYF